MAQVGGLLINLGLDVAQIKKDVGKAQSELSGFRNRVDQHMGKMRRSFKRATSGLKGLVAVMGAGALVRNINQTFEGLENVNRAAESLGADRGTIQELTYAFSQFRLQQDDVNDALGTLSDRAQDAVDGMQSFRDDFALVGIEVDELRNKSPGELFDLFASKISQVDDPTRRTAAAVRIFGDDLGRNLLPLLMEGEEGLDRYAQKAREVGAVQSDDLVQSGTEAAQTMRELRQTLGAQFTTVVAENAEAIEDLGGAFTTLAHWVGQATGQVVDFTRSVSESLAASLHGSDDALERLKNQLADAEDLLEQERRNEREMPNYEISPEQEQQMKNDIQNLRDLIQLEEELRARENERQQPSGARDIEPAPSPDGSTESPSSSGRSEAPPRFQGVRASVPSQMTQVDQEMREAREWWKNYWSEQDDNQERVSEGARQIGDTFSSAFQDAVFEGEKLRGVLDGLVGDIRRIIFQQTVTKPLGDAVSSALPSFAEGGVASGPRSGYMAELHGDEAVVPLSGGRSIPVEMSGGGGPNITIHAPNADAGVAERLEAMGAQLARRIREVDRSVEPRAIQANSEARARG